MNKPFKKTIMEDEALRLGVSLQSLIDQAKLEGYNVVSETNHPAVGKIVTMQQSASCASSN